MDALSMSSLETGAAALFFAAIFLLGGRLHPLRLLFPDPRASISCGAGMACAYVFVHLMPELHSARGSFAAGLGIPLPLEGMGIYYVALVGFMVFYGLEHASARLRNDAAGSKVDLSFKITLSGFAAYVGLMGYLLVDGLENSAVSIALFAVAIGMHFLAVDHSLAAEHGDIYRRIGRPTLAGMAALGWGLGFLLPLPSHVVALLVAFVSGAVIINSMIMELPSDADGRFVPFLLGGLVYGLILLPLG